MTPQLIIIISLPIVLFALFAGLYVYFAGRKLKREAALNVIKGRSDQIGQTSQDNKEQLNAKRRADLAKKLKETEKLEKSGTGESYGELIAMAGLKISTPVYFGGSAFIGLICALGSHALNQPLYLSAMMGIIGALGLPRMALRFMAGRRQKKFLDDFADVLETIVRMLKAGMPVIEAISMCSREFDGVVKEEMSRIYDEQRIGIPLYEAVQNASKRLPIPEMQMFATAIAIQQQTGASLSEVLANLARVIRARFALKRKVVALSAEAKYSAGIIGALPVFVTVALYVMNPDYIMLLFTDSFGNLLLAAGVGWMAIGIFIMRQMINFKV